MPGAVKWMHAEIDPLGAFQAMQDTAKKKAWGQVPRKKSEHHFRALVMATMQGVRVSNNPPPKGQWGDLPEHSGVYGGGYANVEDCFVGSTIARTMQLLVPPRSVELYDIATIGDGPVERWNTQNPGGDTAAIPIAVLVAAVVVGGSALTVLGVKAIHTAGEVIDKELGRQADVQEVVALHSNVISMSIEHAAREEKAGQTLPWNEGEREAVLTLRRKQDDVAKRQGRPLTGPFDGAVDTVKGWGDGVVNTVGNGVNTVANGVASGIESAVPLLAVGALAFFGK